MKHILFVCAGQSFPTGAFNLLLSLCEQEPASITGLFFCPIDFEAENSASHIPIAAPYVRLQEKERNQVRFNKFLFARQCAERSLRYTVHENEGQWDKGLFEKETRFADLVVLSGELFYEQVDSSQPNYFLKGALRDAECPVMIVPEAYVAPQRIVIAYDGSKECLFAIKQFCYLFPGYTDLPVDIVYAKAGSTDDIPEIERMKEFARLHFSSPGISRLPFNEGDFLAARSGEGVHALLVAGSFGRSGLSYITRHSFAQQAVCDHKMPVFIAHT